MRSGSVAETMLRNLGVDNPRQIDLEAIAWTIGAEVRFAPLDSCEARIIGFGGRAIITIDPRHDRRRQRFSIGHELGHWRHHRGRSSICRAEDIGSPVAGPLNPERVADAFAADLLLPQYLFEPSAARLRRATFTAIDTLADAFDTSRTATALRMIAFGPEPSMLVCHSPAGRRWFRWGRGVPNRWFPREDLDAQSNAFEALHGRVDRPDPFLIGADAWFDRREAEQFEVYEQSVRASGGDVLTLLTFKYAEMLE